MEFAPEDVRLLGELALLAVGEGQLNDAKAIVEALEAIRPGDVSVYVARAMAELRSENALAAVRLLREEALPRHPESELLRAFLGLSLQAAGFRAQSVEILEQVVQQGGDIKAVALAQALLTPNETVRGPAEGIA